MNYVDYEHHFYEQLCSKRYARTWRRVQIVRRPYQPDRVWLPATSTESPALRSWLRNGSSILGGRP